MILNIKIAGRGLGRRALRLDGQRPGQSLGEAVQPRLGRPESGQRMSTSGCGWYRHHRQAAQRSVDGRLS